MGTAVSSRALFLTDPSTAQWCGCSAGGGYSSHFIQFSLLLCVRRCSKTTGKVVFSFSFSLLFCLFLIILKPVSPSSSSRAGVESHLSLSTPLVTLLHVSMPWPHSGACCHLSAKDRAARAAHCCFKAKDELWWKLKLWVCHRWHKVEHITSYTHTRGPLVQPNLLTLPSDKVKKWTSAGKFMLLIFRKHWIPWSAMSTLSCSMPSATTWWTNGSSRMTWNMGQRWTPCTRTCPSRSTTIPMG